MPAILTQWILVTKNNPSNDVHLIGLVSGHPRLTDGQCVRTAAVAKAEGSRILTNNGSEYILQDPHPDTRKQLPKLDLTNPLLGLI